jgi:hypothetical protein
MTELVIYTLIALAVLVLTVSLVRIGPRHVTEESEQATEPYRPREGINASFLQLGDKIFDPRDYRWLRYELSLPGAAEDLARHRQRLATEWLESLRNSFQELVRTPEPAATSAGREFPSSSWRLLWLTLRFHFLVSYALFVVRFFGPYHLLIPSFGWMDCLPRWALHEEESYTVKYPIS